MKNSKQNLRHLVLIISVLYFSLMSVKAQYTTDTIVKKPVIAILDFDTKGYNFNQEQAIQYVINELIRIGTYEVMDKYEVAYIAKTDTLTTQGCFSKVCLSKAGKHLKTDKMFTGSIQLLGDRVNVTLRLLDVKSGVFEKTLVKEFLNITGSELMMIRVSINELFALKNDEELVKKLTIQSEYESTINNPYKLVLRADGPRLGIVGFTGATAQTLMNPVNKGGYNPYPFMCQFGYQFEKQYLNEGNFQALLEIIPNISGMDQGRLIPSFTFLNGLRNNRKGWEFAFGPTFNLVKMAEGFYYEDEWHLANEAKNYTGLQFDMVKRPDNRGSVTATAGFLFAIGKTFKSGKMNIPLNLFFIPGTSGARFGLSFGWNGKERYESTK